jgi:cardiolipin synthase C
MLVPLTTGTRARTEISSAAGGAASAGFFFQAAVRACLLLAVLLTGCATLPPPTDKIPEHAFASPGETRLGVLAHTLAEPHPDKTGLVLLDTGYQAFLLRAAMIEAAERSIDAQYYIWNSDLSGAYLARRLLLAADRGVRVRVLLDDMNVKGRDEVIATLAGHPNIDVRIYNPQAVREGAGKLFGFAADFRRLNRRMHNKTFVVDGALGIVGGRNIGDEYFDLRTDMNHRDRDVLAVGPPVRDMSTGFDAYWNSPWSYPIGVLAPGIASESEREAQLARAREAAADTGAFWRQPPVNAAQGQLALEQAFADAFWAEAEMVFDPPVVDMQEDTERPMRTAEVLRALVEESTSEILIESAYFVLGDGQLENLARTRARGVRVSVLTNSLASNDVTANHAGYARRRPAIVAGGVELRELRPDAAACRVWVETPGFCELGHMSLHAKSAVFDRRVLFIGSFNVNLRSIYLNGETLLVIRSEELASRVADDIEMGMAAENSWQVQQLDDGWLLWSSGPEDTWRREPEAGWWQRFKSGLIASFPIEKYL